MPCVGPWEDSLFTPPSQGHGEFVARVSTRSLSKGPKLYLKRQELNPAHVQLPCEAVQGRGH